MYCKKCGKFTDNQDGLCEDCKTKESVNTTNNVDTLNTVDTPPVYTEEQKSADRRLGLGGAIASAVMGFVAFIISYISIFLSALIPVLSLFLMVAVIVLGIISLTKGIKSITIFIKNGKEKRARPIATLIVGIGGIVFSGFAFLFTIISFFIAIIMLSYLQI